MRSFFYCLDRVSSDAYNSSNKELCELCYDIKQFVLGGTFTRYKKAGLLLSYWGETDRYVSSMTGMKESTVRVTRRNLSNALYELFGYDLFTVIAVGDRRAIAEGRNRLKLVSRDISADSFLYREFIDSIIRGTSCSSDVDIRSCASEIQFLVRHSRNTIAREIALLDRNKLAYLIRMLNNEEGSVSSISNLVKCFEK